MAIFTSFMPYIRVLCGARDRAKCARALARTNPTSLEHRALNEKLKYTFNLQYILIANQNIAINDICFAPMEY